MNPQPHAPPSATDTVRPIRMGLIGCGAVASYGHLPAIAATPGLELVAVCDPDSHRLQ